MKYTAFCFRGSLVNKFYLRRLCTSLHDKNFADYYLLGPHLKPGRNRSLDYEQRDILFDLPKTRKAFRVNNMLGNSQ